MDPLVFRRGLFFSGGNALRQQQAGRSGAWRTQWPDSSDVLAVRGRLTRLFRFLLCWPSAAFLPDDPMDAILSLNDQAALERDDLAEMVLRLEDVTGIEFPEEGFGGLTFIGFIRQILDKGVFDPACIDAEALRPLRLPDGYYRPGLRAAAGRHFGFRRQCESLRLQHALRGPSWRDAWRDRHDDHEVRALFETVLTGPAGWIDAAFLPGDSLAAMLLLPEKQARQTLAAVNTLFAAAFSLRDLRNPEVPYGDFLTLLSNLRR